MATCIWIGTDSGNEGDWETAANWSGAAVPANGDTVIFEHASEPADTNLDQSAVTLAALIIKQSFTGAIGTATAYLQIGATLLDIGEHHGYGTPTGSGRLKINLGAVASTVVIHNTSSTPASGDTYLMPVRLLCNEGTTDIYVRRGRVSIGATAHSDTSTLDQLHIGHITGKASDAVVHVGSGVTLDELFMRGGECILECALTTSGTIDDGTLHTHGSGAIATLNVAGGTVYSSSTGTITTLNHYGGSVDFTRNEEARTVTTYNLYRDAILKYDPSRITVTNKLAPTEEMTVTCTAL